MCAHNVLTSQFTIQPKVFNYARKKIMCLFALQFLMSVSSVSRMAHLNSFLDFAPAHHFRFHPSHFSMARCPSCPFMLDLLPMKLTSICLKPHMEEWGEGVNIELLAFINVNESFGFSMVSWMGVESSLWSMRKESHS